MSILAGKGGFLAALHHMQSVKDGNGTLLANVCGVEAPVISIIGAVETCKRVVKIRWME